MNLLTTLLAAVGCCFLVTGCSETEQTDDAAERSAQALKAPAVQPGIHRKFLTLSGEGAVNYVISIPPGYDGTKPTPLVLALHWGDPGIPFAGIGLIRSLIGPALKDLDPIIIAPDSMGGDWMEPATESAIIELLDFIESTYPIDQSKILVTGFSMGGRGTWHMGSRSPERFTLAIPIAAEPDSTAVWTLPVYAINSDSDDEMPLELTEAYIRQLQEGGVDATIAVISGIPHNDSTGFTKPLSEAVPWIRAHWDAPADIPDDPADTASGADASAAAP